MKNYTVTTSTNLINLCAGAGIFTDATKKQTERLLVENGSGCPIEQLGAMIWMCSDNSIGKYEIINMLKIERLYFYKKLFPGVDSINEIYYFTNFDGRTVNAPCGIAAFLNTTLNSCVINESRRLAFTLMENA